MRKLKASMKMNKLELKAVVPLLGPDRRYLDTRYMNQVYFESTESIDEFEPA
jgi:hypothetical protein